MKPVAALHLLILMLVSGFSAGCAAWWPNSGGAVQKQGTQYGGQIRAGSGDPAAPIRTQELRLRLERFADRYTDGVAWEVDQLAVNPPSPEARRAAMDHRLAYPSSVIMIASGPDPGLAVLDMLVFVSLVRMSLEDYWVPNVYGEAGQALLATARAFEQESWKNARDIGLLDEEQLKDLRAWLIEWRQENPNRQYVESVRFGALATHLSQRDESKARGLVADVRHATQTADAALELGERMMYVMHRAPFIWTRHAEWALFDMMSQPEIQAVLADTDQISDSAERLSITTERLADALLEAPSGDQAALITGLVEADTRLRAVMAETRETLSVTSALVKEVNALVVELDLGGGDSGQKPFDILEYQATAAEYTRSVAETRALIEALNEFLTSPTVGEKLPSALLAAEDKSEAFFEYAVILLIVAMVVSVLITTLALLGYHYVSKRMDARLQRRLDG